MGPVAAFSNRVETLRTLAGGEDAARDTLGPGWREFAGRLGSPVYGAVG